MLVQGKTGGSVRELVVEAIASLVCRLTRLFRGLCGEARFWQGRFAQSRGAGSELPAFHIAGLCAIVTANFRGRLKA